MKLGERLSPETLSNLAKDVGDGDFFKNRYTVVFFYPSNNTPGCNAQACSFRDGYGALLSLGAAAVGVSRNSALSHQQFRQKFNLPYPLVADGAGAWHRTFGVKNKWFGLLRRRVSFVLSPGGELIHVFDSNPKSTQHITQSMAAIERHRKASGSH